MLFMGNSVSWLKIVGWGGLSFWLPDIAWHSIRKEQFSISDVLILTLGLPLISGIMREWLWRRCKDQSRPRSFPFLMMLGIWALGPLLLLCAYSALGDGLERPKEIQMTDALWVGLLIIVIGFPVGTIMMSTYDGTLGAVVLSTIVLLLLGLVRPGRPQSVLVEQRESDK